MIRSKKTKISNAYLLFNTYYLCKIPYAEHMDVNDFEYFGIATSGDRDTDAILAKQLVTVQLSPAQMAQYIGMAVPVTLDDPKDCTKIYGLVMAHLSDWRAALENPVRYFNKIPLEGLIEFNRMAHCLVNLGRGYGLVEQIAGKRRRAMGRTFSEVYQRESSVGDAHHSNSVIEDILIAAGDLGFRTPKVQALTYSHDEGER